MIGRFERLICISNPLKRKIILLYLFTFLQNSLLLSNRHCELSCSRYSFDSFDSYSFLDCLNRWDFNRCYFPQKRVLPNYTSSSRNHPTEGMLKKVWKKRSNIVLIREIFNEFIYEFHYKFINVDESGKKLQILNNLKTHGELKRLELLVMVYAYSSEQSRGWKEKK